MTKMAMSGLLYNKEKAAKERKEKKKGARLSSNEACMDDHAKRITLINGMQNKMQHGPMITSMKKMVKKTMKMTMMTVNALMSSWIRCHSWRIISKTFYNHRYIVICSVLLYLCLYV